VRLVLLFLTFWTTLAFGQVETIVSGKIQDRRNKEALPFVSVGFKGIPGGITSDFEGRFTLKTR
jgi:hypothetical protein